MARGDPAFQLENLVPYMRGAQFAVTAMRMRHGQHDPDLAADQERYVAMAMRFQDAAKATFKLRQERGRG
ncbi:MAG: hypothetical protein NVS9B1_26060 [Candidatus Dormibacteraceae bacterium]